MAAERRRRWLRCAELLGQITDSGVAQSSIAVTEGCPILATSPVMGEVIGSMDASTKKLLKRYSEINKALNISEILR